MKRLAIDTNRYTDLARGESTVAAMVATAERVYLPFVVIAELRAGFAVGKHGDENERVLKRFLTKPGVAMLFPDEGTTRAYAALYRQLRGQGTSIPTGDIWIAALVVQHSLTLATRDQHFRNLPQLDLV
jgi:predicted nucleic acid-binding protein